MFGRNKIGDTSERLDRIGRAIIRASAATSEAEAEAAASSPFLYARLRARIAAERREEGDGWLALLGVVWRAVPAMSLAAIFAVILFLSAGSSALTPGVLSDEALLDERDAGIEHVVFADRRSMSNDDVLATLISDEREASR